VVAAIMSATAGGLPFNMGFWGFIFPVGQSPFVTLTPKVQDFC
jgi:tellurite resistance protein TehA-like permease